MTDKFSIQQVAEQTNLSPHTLRYYERIGLIHPVHRGDNGHREYTAGDVGWIDFLKKLRATGMPIRQMLQYAQLQAEGDYTVNERLDILREHHTKIKAELDELLRYLEVIEYKIGHYQQVADEMQAETA
ncbi:MAG: MerR family transcriptional regulator [Chloroflexi bacterium]|nr:MerR family transcriptional regulator [Chloroflexota bacterium]